MPLAGHGCRSLKYRQLHRQAAGAAGGRRQQDGEPGDRVVLIAPNSVEWMVVDRAFHLGGLLPLAPVTRLHPREIAQIVTDAEPVVVIAEGAQ